MTQYQTEKEFAQAVVEYAEAQGWRVFRTWNSWHSPAGEPDLRMHRGPRYLLAELKSEKGRLTKVQKEVQEELQQCFGVESWLWKPSQWDEIERRLQ